MQEKSKASTYESENMSLGFSLKNKEKHIE